MLSTAGSQRVRAQIQNASACCASALRSEHFRRFEICAMQTRFETVETRTRINVHAAHAVQRAAAR
eukprot:9580572-Lingulodinium_polyedra.AAC.1